MNKPLLLSALVLSLAASAKPVSKPIDWELGGTKFQGVLVFDDATKAPRPGLVLVPNWLGVTEANVKQAQLIAADRYVILVADVYGTAARPKTQEEAGKLSGALKGDRKLLRERSAKALAVLLAQAKAAPLEVAKVGAIGFCFGGTAALELARSGAKLAGVVSFHGGLDTPNPADAKAITGKVLALHGADDPFVPADVVKGFEEEMRAAKIADWELIKYGGAVHSFTDVDANMPGQAQYNASVTKRAYARMNGFFADAFGG
jgi:dienelactone hydrolase